MATGLDAFIDKSKTAMTAGVSAQDALEADASLQDVVKALDEFLMLGGGRVLEQENDCFPVAPRWSVEGVTARVWSAFPDCRQESAKNIRILTNRSPVYRKHYSYERLDSGSSVGELRTATNNDLFPYTFSR